MNLSAKNLVPHGGAMMLLDHIDSYVDEQGLSASVLIKEDSMFMENRGVPSWVGLEYMGQAIAAYAGAKARQEKRQVKIGFLVSTRRYEPTISYFPKGAQLIISVSPITFDTTGLQVFKCSIHCDLSLVVTTNLNVYMPKNVSTFMKENSI